jgi:hypothetical protein
MRVGPLSCPKSERRDREGHERSVVHLRRDGDGGEDPDHGEVLPGDVNLRHGIRLGNAEVLGGAEPEHHLGVVLGERVQEVPAQQGR